MHRTQITTGFLALCLTLSDTASALSIKHPTRAVSYSALGCYTDNANGKRALTGKSTAADDMSVQKCASFCSQFSLFGLEYGRECFCGNSRDEGSVKASENDCSFSCTGNPGGAEKCGAGDRLNLYSNSNVVTIKPATLPGITSLGCFVDNGNRVLPMGFANAQDMTAAKCAQNCAGYTYFGTQYSSECYCGYTAPTVSAPASECNMACAGNGDELCGNGMRLNVYRVDPPSAVSSSAAASSTPTPTTPSIVVSGYGYQGCYTDNVPQRVLSGKSTADAAMTLEKCAAFCSKSGYSWFGVEYSSECYCGTNLDALSVPSREGACDAKCSGDTSQKCGGANLLNVYKNVALVVPTPQSSASLNGFKYKSCWTDDVNDRSLKGVDYRADDMTTKKCADRCTDYAYFGLEYGSECFCGAALSGKAAPETDCGMLCSGASGELCGGANRMTVYTKDSAVDVSSSSTLSTAASSGIASSIGVSMATTDTVSSTSSVATVLSTSSVATVSSASSVTIVSSETAMSSTTSSGLSDSSVSNLIASTSSEVAISSGVSSVSTSSTVTSSSEIVTSSSQSSVTPSPTTYVTSAATTSSEAIPSSSTASSTLGSLSSSISIPESSSSATISSNSATPTILGSSSLSVASSSSQMNPSSSVSSTPIGSSSGSTSIAATSSSVISSSSIASSSASDSTAPASSTITSSSGIFSSSISAASTSSQSPIDISSAASSSKPDTSNSVSSAASVSTPTITSSSASASVTPTFSGSNASSASPAASQSSSLIPTSTLMTVVTPSSTVPSLTTITSCPPKPTYVDQPGFCVSSFPSICSALTNYDAAISYMSYSLDACRRSVSVLTASIANPATTCFPSLSFGYVVKDRAAATSTLSSVQSCLLAPSNSLVCQFDSTCATKTYTVGQEPSKTPSLDNKEIFQDGGFESGTLGGWKASSIAGVNYATLKPVISTAKPHSGKYSISVKFDKTNNAQITWERTVPLTPGKIYEISTWFWFEITSANNDGVCQYSFGGSSDGNTVQIKKSSVPQWIQAKRQYTNNRSLDRFTVTVQCLNPPGTVQDNIVAQAYFDDWTLNRLN